MRIFIDAIAEIEDGKYLMNEKIGSRTLFERLVSLAAKVGAEEVMVNVPEDGKEEARSVLSAYFPDGKVTFGRPKNSIEWVELNVRNVYDESLFLRNSRSGERIDRSVIWRIESKSDLASAREELERTQWFPIARFYILPAAKNFARILAKTSLTANQLTGISFIVGLLAASCVLSGVRVLYVIAGILYLGFWLLDLTDGRLARIKGEASGYGKWLDSIVGESMDFIIYLSVAANLYFREENVVFLWIAIFYFIGKHLTLYFMQTGKEAFGEDAPKGVPLGTVPKGTPCRRQVCGALSKAAHLIHDADIRKHLMAVSMALDVMWLPLAFYAVYFNAWTLAKFVLECMRHSKRR